MEMTDCLTVMRDGKNVGSYTRDEYDQNKIVEDMIGRKLTVMYPERACSIGEELLRVEHLDVEHPYIADRYLVQDFNLTVRAGEVVGLAGLVGAGRSEAVMGIYGELKRSHGTIYVAGQKVQIHNPRDAIRHRDRHGHRRPQKIRTSLHGASEKISPCRICARSHHMDLFS